MSPAAPTVSAAVILAAGRGTRMKSHRPKAAHPLLGKPMAAYPAEICRRLGVERILVVVGHQGEAVRAALGEGYEYVDQGQARGTGDALRVAVEALGAAEGAVLVLHGDSALLTDAVAQSLLERHADTGASTFLTAQLPLDNRYGRLLRDAAGAPLRVVETAGAGPDILAISESNAGSYVFNLHHLRQALPALTPDPTTGELYLTQLIELFADASLPLEAVRTDDPESALSVNDRVELAQAVAVLRRRILRGHMLNGVTVDDPASTYVDADVVIGRDTVLRPQTYLGAGTVIGEECEIGPFARIDNCRLGDRVMVQSALLTDSEVGDDTRIGPFAQLRPGARVGRKVKIGNFVELKKTRVDDGASIGHFAYLGDAEIGERTNIGAGTITCNYDGKHKHKTVIGRDAFVGTHATLVAPVTVGDGAFIAAASAVTEDVPADALAIGRARQTTKPGWAKERRERE